MGRKRSDVTDAELAVLESLWEDGPATTRRLADSLYPDGTVSHYATVKKLLERLEAKGCVSRDRSSNIHVFQAAIPRDILIGRRLKALADTLCNGSMSPLLMHLIQAEPLSHEDCQMLRALIEKLDKSSDSQHRTATD